MAEEVGTYTKGPSPLSHTFQLAEGITDVIAITEVWADDTYRVADLNLEGATVLDVGANVGAFSVLAAQLGAARVEAYEPHPDNFQALQANTSRLAQVNAHQVAVGSVPGIGALGGVGAGAHLLPDPRQPGILVNVVNINELLAEEAESEVVLKMDCEGSEYQIVEAMTLDSLAKVRTVVMEWHPPGMPLWGLMVAKLASWGKLRVEGRPQVGGLLWGWKYSQAG